MLFEKYGVISEKEIDSINVEGKYFYSDLERVYSTATKAWGVVDKNKELIIPCIYDRITNDDCGFIEVIKKVDNKYKYGLYNKYGKEVVPCIVKKRDYTILSPNLVICEFNSNEDTKKYFGDEVNHKILLISNENGVKYVDWNYEAITRLFGGIKIYYCGTLIKVEKTMSNGQHKFGFIDGQSGLEKVQCQYDDFMRKKIDDEEVIIAESNNKYGLFNKEGIEIAPCIYDKFIPFSNLIITKKDNKYGILNGKGNELAPCIYDRIKYLDDKISIVQNKDTTGVINNMNGHFISLEDVLFSENNEFKEEFGILEKPILHLSSSSKKTNPTFLKACYSEIIPLISEEFFTNVKKIKESNHFKTEKEVNDAINDVKFLTAYYLFKEGNVILHIPDNANDTIKRYIIGMTYDDYKSQKDNMVSKKSNILKRVLKKEE